MNFLNIRLSMIILVVSLIGLYAFKRVNTRERSGIRIGIVTPMAHPAMDQIVNGFKEQFTALYKKPVVFDVQCAQGDDTLMRAIIQSFITKNVAFVAPVGKKATQMSMSMVCNQPVIGVAVDLPENERTANSLCSVTGVCDEISRKLQVDMISQIFPEIKKIAIVYSASEKVFSEVDEFVMYAQKAQIQVQKCMVQAMSELYTVSKTIDSDEQALFVLKDHMIVSGINTLVKEAQMRNVPVITSDNGSVEHGALCALGIEETEIGRAGARLAAKIVQHEIDPKKHATEIIDKLTVFVNKHVKHVQPVLFEIIKKYAQSRGYALQEV
ncbi:MAG: ABC transporter substrate binding protein [bacterium]